MEQTYDYAVENDYTFSDITKLRAISGDVKLLLQQDDVDFTEDCEDDTDFTYDSDLVEFLTSLFRQIDKRPTDCDFYASYTYDENGSWGNGTLDATLGGSANAHDGYLDLTDGYVEYPINNFTTMSGNAGCIQFRIAFDYSGAASSIQYIVQTSPNLASRVYIAHNTSFIQCYISNADGTAIYSMTFSWTPNAGTIYNFAVNWTSSHAYFFINGNLESSDTGSLSIAVPELFKVGGGVSTAFKIYDIAVFDSLQHSSNYSPSWSVFYEKAYLKSICVFPEMEHTGDGSINLFNLLSITYTGEIGILLEIGRSGNKLYWTGSEWGVSSDPYTQYTSLADFNNYQESLPVSGEKYGQFTIVFFDSNTQGSVSELTANMNVDIGYSTSNPYFYPKEPFGTDGLENWVETVTKIGSDNVKRLIKLDDDIYYLNAGIWTVGTIDYSLSMAVSEILAQKESLLTEGYKKDFTVITFLHSEDGTTTPTLSNDVITYNFCGGSPVLTEHIIYYNNYLLDSTPKIETLSVKPVYNVYGTTSRIKNEVVSIDINPNGYWEAHLYTEDVLPTYLLWNFGGRKIKTNFLEGIHSFSELTRY